MFVIGAHSGERVIDVMLDEPSYIESLLGSEMSEEERVILASALGRVPGRVIEMVKGDDGVYRVETGVVKCEPKDEDSLPGMMSELFRNLRGE